MQKDLIELYHYKSSQNRYLIKQALRKAFRRSPQFRDAMLLAKRELPLYRMDGTLAKKGSVRYECASCEGLFPAYKVQVDHIVELVPLDGDDADIESYDDLAFDIFCNINNLQVLCCVKKEDNGGVYSCHMAKTLLNRYIRKQIREMKGAGSFTGLTQELVDSLTLQYEKHLINQELERIAKEERKRKRAEKKK